MRSSEYSSDPMPQLDLVVTKPPSRLILHPELGLFKSPHEAIRNLGRKYAYLSGEVIGLEWQTPDGKAIIDNDLWSRRFYMPASYYPEGHRFTDIIHGYEKQPLTLATLYEPSASSEANINCSNINRWIDMIWKSSNNFKVELQMDKNKLNDD